MVSTNLFEEIPYSTELDSLQLFFPDNAFSFETKFSLLFSKSKNSDSSETYIIESFFSIGGVVALLSAGLFFLRKRKASKTPNEIKIK